VCLGCLLCEDISSVTGKGIKQLVNLSRAILLKQHEDQLTSVSLRCCSTLGFRWTRIGARRCLLHVRHERIDISPGNHMGTKGTGEYYAVKKTRQSDGKGGSKGAAEGKHGDLQERQLWLPAIPMRFSAGPLLFINSSAVNVKERHSSNNGPQEEGRQPRRRSKAWN
jgi:hypothetical protein